MENLFKPLAFRTVTNKKKVALKTIFQQEMSVTV